MGEHHALRLARRARRVDDRGEIDVDAPARRSRPRRHREWRRPRRRAPGRSRTRGIERAGDDHGTRCGACAASRSPSEQVRSRVTIAARAQSSMMIRELVGLGQRVDDRDDRVCLQRGPERDGRLGCVVAEHNHAIAAVHAAIHERGGEPFERASSSQVTQPLLAADERDLVAERVAPTPTGNREAAIRLGRGRSRIGSDRRSSAAPALGLVAAGVARAVRCKSCVESTPTSAMLIGIRELVLARQRVHSARRRDDIEHAGGAQRAFVDHGRSTHSGASGAHEARARRARDTAASDAR